MKAKYYIYKNLHRDMFSIRYKGKVIEHARHITVRNAIFKVNEAGRQRVLATKQKNVHAFVVAENYSTDLCMIISWDHYKKVRYNPYINEFFFDEDGNKMEASKLLLIGPHGLYSLKEDL